jgi:hypothetical protein
VPKEVAMKPLVRCAALFVLVVSSGLASAQGLTTASPEQVGLSSVRSGQITWTPASMIEERGLGQTKSQTVSFSSAENLVNVEIYVSPELRRLVRVHPTRFQRVDHGQSISVSITIAASATTSLGKASGSVQLVRNDLRPEVLFESLPVTVLVTAVPLSPDPGVLGKAILAGGR